MPEVPRNAPCPCGSGRKYKRCCKPSGKKAAPAFDGTYLRFRVALRYTEPEVWRRFLLRADASFLDLHRAIQDCGWTDSHLWHFVEDSSGRVVAGIPDELSLFREPTPEASGVPLASFFRSPEAACTYTYDFGDSWDHDVVCEGTEQHEGRFERALLDGAGSFPPEDCGGIPGFARILEFARTGQDPWEDEESAADLAQDLISRPFELAAEAACFGAVLDALQEHPRPGPSLVTEAHRVHRLDRATMDRIMARVEPFLVQLGDELGLQIGVQRASYSQVNATIQVEAATVRDDGVVLDKLAVQFLEGCREFGLEPDDLGREFILDGERLQVIGLKPRARLPVLCERVSSTPAPDPGRLRLSAVCAREALERSSSRPRPTPRRER